MSFFSKSTPPKPTTTKEPDAVVKKGSYSTDWLQDYNLLRKPETFAGGVIVKNRCVVLFVTTRLVL